MDAAARLRVAGRVDSGQWFGESATGHYRMGLMVMGPMETRSPTTDDPLS